jgi:hypothetical protein
LLKLNGRRLWQASGLFISGALALDAVESRSRMLANRLPIMADALMDAGCDSEEILGHCRGAGPHVLGCWVVDLLLGKS